MKMYSPLVQALRCAPLFAVLLWVAGVARAGAETPAASPAQNNGAATPSGMSKDTELPEVVVAEKSAPKKESTPPAKEGSAESGYRSTTATVGPLGRMSLQDTPYSISVTPSALIEDIQAGNPTDALKLNPTVNPEMGSNRTGDYLSIRGFINSENQAMDGMRQALGNGAVLEDKERIEILSGADSFLYGIASPAGMVNYVLKRPTPERLLKVTLGDYGGGQAYTHVDAGGPIDNAGKLGYRINLLGVDDGSTGIDSESHKRTLFSGAFDWHVTPKTLWSFDSSYCHRDLEHMQAFFKIGTVTRVPDAPDASRNYGAPYNGSENTHTSYGTGLTSVINSMFTVRTAFRYSDYESNGFRSMRNVWVDNAGDYKQQMMYYLGQQKEETIQGNIFLDSSFHTGFAKHKVTAGYIVDHVPESETSPGTATYSFPATTIFNMSNPGYSPYPNITISKHTPYIMTERVTRQSVILADQVVLSRRWSVLGGATYAKIRDINYPASTGDVKTIYDKGQFTPSGAIMFKPISAITTYVSFIEALNEGPIAPDDATNANAILPPFMSTQEEAGVKAVFRRMSVNAAFFRIEQANAYTDPVTGIYSEDGREVHIGGEVSWSGKITNDLTLLGGFSVLRATIQKTSTAAMEGKTPQAVPESIARLYGDYALPFLRGLSLTGGVYYTGKEWVNDSNTLSISHVVTGDVGARYRRKVLGKDTTFRLNVNNVTDKNYWTTKGGGMLYLGSPRIVATSMTVQF